MILINIGIILASLFVIFKSGAILVKSLVIISRFLKLSEYLVSFILMALVTSLPELFIGITSAISKVPVISFGNVIGANIINLTLGIGLVVVIIRRIEVKTETVKKEAWNIFFLALLPIFLALDGILSSTDGIILLLFFLWYIFRLLGQRQKFVAQFNSYQADFAHLTYFFKNLGLFILGAILLLAASWTLVYSISALTEYFKFSLIFVGLTLIALGTALPEISFGIRSGLLKHQSMSLGNFVGSIAFNSLFVLGIVAIIHPIKIDINSVFIVSAIFLALSLIVFNIFIRTKEKLSYKEGIIMIIIYGLFLITELLVI